jgi:hypothetical protein
MSEEGMRAQVQMQAVQLARLTRMQAARLSYWV